LFNNLKLNKYFYMKYYVLTKYNDLFLSLVEQFIYKQESLLISILNFYKI